MSLFLLVIYAVLQFYAFLMGLNIIFSWFPGIYRFKICRIINYLSDWFLGQFHGIVILGPIDFSSMIALTVYQFIISQIYLIVL